MKAIRSVLCATIALVCCCVPALAEDPTPGEMNDIACANGAAESYSVYLPKAYTAERAWPALFCFQTMGRVSDLMWQYEELAEAEGFILVGVPGASLGAKDWDQAQAATSAVWADAKARFSLTETMRYAIGFDGAALMALVTAINHPGECSGIILLAPPEGGVPVGAFPEKTAVYLAAGKTDTTVTENALKETKKSFEKNGNPVKLEMYDAGHELPEGKDIEGALRWFLDINEERKAILFREGITESEAEFKDGKPMEAYVRVIGLLDKYEAIREHVGAARRLRNDILKDPALADEVKALDLWDKARKNEEKNQDKFKDKPFAVRSAIGKYEDIVKKYPDTPCAARAQAKIDELSNYLPKD